MPGRLALYDDTGFKSKAQHTFPHFKDEVGQLIPNYNLCPTQNITTLLNNGTYTQAHFGMIPSWAKDKKSMNINARCETLYEKKSFRDSFKYKRCLVVINGFYEWKEHNKEKIPYLIKPNSDTFFALAGLYDEWYDSHENKTLLSVALITTQPNETVAKIHDRMPVILEQHHWKQWLNSDNLQEVNALLHPCKNNFLSIHEVGSLVNKISNNSKECIEEVNIKRFIQATLF